jgi:hypothetical protein
MAIQDATDPAESALGMAVANNAFLGTLIQALLDKNVITQVELMNIIGAARRDVSQFKVSTIHRDADLILAKLQKRFPVA